MAAEMAEKLVSQLTLRAEEEPEEVGFFLFQCCGSGIRCLFDPGIRVSKNSYPGWKKLGSGINILDPQHCLNNTVLIFCNMLLDLKISVPYRTVL